MGLMGRSVSVFSVWVGVGDGDAEITSLLYDTTICPVSSVCIQKLTMTCSSRPSGNWLTTSIWMSKGISCYLGILGFLHVLRRLAGAFEALCDVLGKAAMQHLSFGSIDDKRQENIQEDWTLVTFATWHWCVRSLHPSNFGANKN